MHPGDVWKTLFFCGKYLIAAGHMHSKQFHTRRTILEQLSSGHEAVRATLNNISFAQDGTVYLFIF